MSETVVIGRQCWWWKEGEQGWRTVYFNGGVVGGLVTINGSTNETVLVDLASNPPLMHCTHLPCPHDIRMMLDEYGDPVWVWCSLCGGVETNYDNAA